MPISQLLIQDVNVTTDYVLLKFGPSVAYNSIQQEDFVVTKDDGTPVTIDDPFEEILLIDHYHAVDRELTLYWKANILEASTSYTLTVSNIKTASGQNIDSQSVTFTTEDSVEQAPNFPAEPPEIEIEDHSLHSGVFDIIVGGDSSSSDEFTITETDPINGEYYLEEDYEDGRVTVKFNAAPGGEYLTSSYFKAQRKPIQRAPIRWERLTVEISADSTYPWVYVDFPSVDDEDDVVYRESGREYFETGYKYRLIVSRNVGT